jgi:hypothetical protein
LFTHLAFEEIKTDDKIKLFFPNWIDWIWFVFGKLEKVKLKKKTGTSDSKTAKRFLLSQVMEQ